LFLGSPATCFSLAVWTGFPCQRGDGHFTGSLGHRSSLGAGYAWTELFRGGTNRETVVELFYKARLAPGLAIRPDLQYIASPSGIYGDALVAGLRFQLDL
jgi:hypothetical protein